MRRSKRWLQVRLASQIGRALAGDSVVGRSAVSDGFRHFRHLDWQAFRQAGESRGGSGCTLLHRPARLTQQRPPTSVKRVFQHPAMASLKEKFEPVPAVPQRE
jgi:hypothetical protein